MSTQKDKPTIEKLRDILNEVAGPEIEYSAGSKYEVRGRIDPKTNHALRAVLAEDHPNGFEFSVEI